MDVIILEDDRSFAMKLEAYIRTFCRDFVVLLNTFEISRLKIYIEESKKASIYFLDIIIAQKTLGFEVFQWLRKKNKDDIIIFITEYPEMVYTVPDYKIYAFNYIAKSSSRLYEEIDKTLLHAKSCLKEQQLFIHNNKFRRLSIPLYGIRCIQAGTGRAKDRIIICHDLGIFKMRGSLKEMMILLDDHQFLQCHRSCIVNRNYIRKMDVTKQIVILKTGESCPYSRFHKKELDDWLN